MMRFSLFALAAAVFAGAANAQLISPSPSSGIGLNPLVQYTRPGRSSFDTSFINVTLHNATFSAPLTPTPQFSSNDTETAEGRVNVSINVFKEGNYNFTVVETDPRTKSILSTTSYLVTLDYDI
ncbi:hypothetical protein BD309DRAFT_929133 [Dichomitus squalens]|uniref:Uncharacterized protein n=2 Tax=Dichomitus squalens TaxID=114155 RepID=A0A4Q9NFD2_9APHY|nr:hypothetical protein BD311DRAFT_787220 [Dichomitus squalens]TBU39348.1 hypothetical protein BD309DRAFT_929133 [Dichomitus squalens]